MEKVGAKKSKYPCFYWDSSALLYSSIVGYLADGGCIVSAKEHLWVGEIKQEKINKENFDLL